MKKIFIICLALLSLSGCCTYAKYQKKLNSRLGMSEEDLIKEVGNPSSFYDVNDKRSLEYEYKDFSCSRYGCDTEFCTTRYILKDGKVESWSCNGNSCCSTD